jgi:hypothetical protein
MIALGFRRTSKMLRDLFWTPFDSRFSKLLNRLQTHQELFDSEMSLDHYKMTEEKLCRTLETVLKLKEERTTTTTTAAAAAAAAAAEAATATTETEHESNAESIIKALETQKGHNAKLESSIIEHFSKVEVGIRTIKEQQDTEGARFIVEEMKALSKSLHLLKLASFVPRLTSTQKKRSTQFEPGLWLLNI